MKEQNKGGRQMNDILRPITLKRFFVGKEPTLTKPCRQLCNTAAIFDLKIIILGGLIPPNQCNEHFFHILPGTKDWRSRAIPYVAIPG